MSEQFNLTIDPDNLTIGDMEDFEEGVGKPLSEALKPVPLLDDEGEKVYDEKGRPEMTVSLSAKALRYLVFIVKRHENPDFTPDDARNVRVGQLVIVDDSADAATDGQGNVDGQSD
jgi:hypothetical protein